MVVNADRSEAGVNGYKQVAVNYFIMADFALKLPKFLDFWWN